MRVAVSIIAVFAILLTPQIAFAHCEIPCGIYGDDGRFAAMLEDVQTIEKSMKLINELSTATEKNMNQIVRWVTNKEVHADKIREVVAQYFLAQRVKEPAKGDAAAEKDYHAKLSALHQIIRTAMKCKQTTDVANARQIHDQVHAFRKLYQAK
ncbi:TPA: hypothetical protein DCE37_24700 [Candidatus Latescibacteria bacterium]|nr:hypothetical protein [Candidatus Latescibacterota bacterium]